MDKFYVEGTLIIDGNLQPYTVEKGTVNDLDEIESLYNYLTDYLQGGINYPGWRKGLYPTRETAQSAIADNCLFLLKVENDIAGTVILKHKPEDAYAKVKWSIEADYKDIFVVYTLAVHPKYMRYGVGSKLMKFIKDYGKVQDMKAIRLDVVATNAPACALYEKNGFTYVQTIDLGLSIPGLKWFKCYELIL